MAHHRRHARLYALTLAATTLLTPLAQAATGDTYRVTADKVNLRAGPSDEAAVRTTIEPDERFIELRREGSWLGVRLLDSGEEGWIYSDLVERISGSLLGDEEPSGPFAQLSSDFDHLIRHIHQRLGYRLVDSVQQAGDDTLRIKPTEEWLLQGSREEHIMGAVAFYEMWKNHQNGEPVTLVLLDRDNEAYISLTDTADGPGLAVGAALL